MIKIFDIRRFSVHDGKGIRTTVFFKGCPLRCRWCQNPEGLEDFFKPVWLSGACINCGKCYKPFAASNPEKAVQMLQNIPQERVNEVMDNCPAKAIIRNRVELTGDELIEELKKDSVFFAYNGGCTLSGGEPLAQGELTIGLLEKLRQAGINTAIETSLHAPAMLVDAAAALCDQIFADCKIMDKKKHIEATGMGNEIILDNLDRLLLGKYAEKVIVRIPLVPGFTGGRENITAIADFIFRRNPNIPVELLNYNPLAASKYPYGDFPGKDISDCMPYSAEQMEKFRTIVREGGVKCIESV